MYICNKEKKIEQQPKLHVDGKLMPKSQILNMKFGLVDTAKLHMGATQGKHPDGRGSQNTRKGRNIT
jgi:hypothetical protein